MMEDSSLGALSDLDKIDRAILRELSADGRLSMTELSRRVALSKTPVIARVRQLEALGHITEYGARLGWKQLGLGHITFVEVKLTDTRESALQAFRKSVLEQPEIAECHMIAGSFDYLLKIRTADISAYRRFMGEVISTLPFIASTSTHVVMDAVKEEERFAVDVE